MTVAERVTERLASVPYEEQLRERGVAEAMSILKCSKGEVYRKVADCTLGHLKVDGARRRGRGCAGRVSFLLEHLIRYQVEREVLPGGGPIRKAKRPAATGREGKQGHGESTSENPAAQA